MQRNSYDVVLMDVNMPDVDGIEATKVVEEIHLYFCIWSSLTA